MGNDAKKLASVALVVLRLTRGKLGLGGVAALVVAALLYVAVLQPWAEKRFGVALPTIGATDPGPAAPQADRRNGDTPSRDRDSASRDASTAPDAGELSDVLTETGRDTYRSTAGLRYTRGSQHGTRLAHLMAHARDQPDRVGSHGVFDPGDPVTVVRLVDEVYTQALAGERSEAEVEGDRTVYTVRLGRRVGYIGGQSGNRRGKPDARSVRLVVEGDRFITAFPVTN